MTNSGADGREHRSFWIATAPSRSYPALTSDASVDVAVVGGGIVGITAAALLVESGLRVALLEAKQLVGGVTGHTTAKVTSLHTLIYAHLAEKSEERARVYGEANEAGLATIRRLCAERAIDCDLRDVAAYTYAATEEDVPKLEDEVEAARDAGLAATFTDAVPLPFRTYGAVRFTDQASFHPRRYLLGLASSLPEDRCSVYENTRVVEIEDDPCRVTTEAGNVVSATDVIVATHAPIVDTGLLVARAKAMRGYAIAMEAGDEIPDGMFISASTPSHSLRTAEFDGNPILIVSGEGHPVAESESEAEHFERLEAWARESLKAGNVLHQWSTQDYYSVDRLPFIGPLKEHVYVATAFSGWGMTSGTVAGMLLTDLIGGQENPWAELYDPWRFELSSVPQLLKKAGHDAGRLIGDRLRSRPGFDAIADAGPDAGQVVEIDGDRIAVYRDADLALHAVSAVCTHLGCIVGWNDAERTWDCPCHGSRFGIGGEVLQGPATDRLKDRSDAIAGLPIDA